MPRFLDDRELGPAIIDLMTSKNVRCAVAYWGDGASRKFFGGNAPPKGARIICDVLMGGSNPRELEALGAPNNEYLRHIRGLHAKVYLSDLGSIVCSANASNNGVGFVDAPRLLEAGVFHPADSGIYEAASRWFDMIWETAEAVDEDALALARRSWPSGTSKRHPLPPKRTRDPASLLDMVVHDPHRFSGVGFAFTTTTASREDRDMAAERLHESHRNDPVQMSPAEMDRINTWPIGCLFSRWQRADVQVWPLWFINAHRPAKRLYYSFNERKYNVLLDADEGSILASRRPDLRKELKFEQSIEVMARSDSDRAAPIYEALERNGRPFYKDGEELACFLRTLPPWR